VKTPGRASGTVLDSPGGRRIASSHHSGAVEGIFATDPRANPAYPLVEAARYARVPQATLRSWVRGRTYRKAAGVGLSRALIRPPSETPLLLSFDNLIEAHVLRSLRTDHGVPLDAVRQALDYAQAQLGIERLLLSAELRTDAGQLFLDRYGELLNLSRSGQIAMREVFEQHLRRVEWDRVKLPIRLYPFLSAETSSDRPIAIDPRVAFGRPIVMRSGVSTRAIVDRIDAGEDVADLAGDYDMTEAEIRQAVIYERAA